MMRRLQALPCKRSVSLIAAKNLASTQDHGSNMYSIHKKQDLVSACLKLHMRPTVRKALTYYERKACIICEQHCTLLNCFMNPMLRCF